MIPCSSRASPRALTSETPLSTKIFPLSSPIKWHRGPITEITLREPKYRDFMTLGLPSTWVNVVGGSGFEQENVQALAEWIERLADCDPNALELLSLQDTLALRGAVRDFRTARAFAIDGADLPAALATLSRALP
jgi:hypothetical protein